jgi:hypothetical protein
MGRERIRIRNKRKKKLKYLPLPHATLKPKPYALNCRRKIRSSKLSK